ALAYLHRHGLAVGRALRVAARQVGRGLLRVLRLVGVERALGGRGDDEVELVVRVARIELVVHVAAREDRERAALLLPGAAAGAERQRQSCQGSYGKHGEPQPSHARIPTRKQNRRPGGRRPLAGELALLYRHPATAP